MQNHVIEMVATTLYGMEPFLAEELEQLGAKSVAIDKKAVRFMGDKALLYRCNLQLRTAIKVIQPIGKFQARNPDEMYDAIKQIPWDKYIDLKQTFAVDVALNTNYFNHSHYLALRIKDGIVDYYRQKKGCRPDVNPDQPDIPIHLYVNDQTCYLYLDSSGHPLYKRGYRYQQHTAQMSEVLAAGLIKLSRWNPETILIDPMCGSGTILIEAALLAGNSTPGLFRQHYAFMNWKDYEPLLYKKEMEKLYRHRSYIKTRIIGADSDLESVHLCRQNIKKAGMEGIIQVFHKPLQEFTPPAGTPGMVITNPPYGERLKQEHIDQLYEMMGDRFKQVFSGYIAWVLSSNMDAMKHFGLRPSQKIKIYNGPLECRFHRFELYSGSRKTKYQ